MCRDWIFIPGSGELRGAPAQGREASCPRRKGPLAAAVQVTGRGVRSARSCRHGSRGKKVGLSHSRHRVKGERTEGGREDPGKPLGAEAGCGWRGVGWA